MNVEDYQRMGLHERFATETTVNGRSNFELVDALAVPEDEQYYPCAEAFPTDDVPSGRVGLTREWTDVRATKVLDTLIHAGQIPAMAALFVMPGRLTPNSGDVPGQDADPRDMEQRSFEYDSLTPLYGDFLVNEILPIAARTMSVSFTADANQRAICGISSGGICAFNTAWHHPESFTRVMSHCGSFVNIRGGHNYPYLVRSTPKKPIRILLASGKNDGNIIFGSWPLANQQMAAALDYAGYEYRFEHGEGGHSLRHGGGLFAESMRWLWR